MMRSHGWARPTTLALVLALVVAACGTDGGATPGATDEPTAAPAAEGEGTGSEDDSGSAPFTDVEPAEFSFAMGSPGSVATLMKETVAIMRDEHGHNAEFVEVADSDLVVEGASAGEFEMGSSTTSAVMNVIQDGAPLKFIIESGRNQWTLQAKAGIENCADMDGMRLGLHSPGGTSTALYRTWSERNCDENSTPEEIFIAGSPNRLQGMLVDQLDVAMVEVEDGLELPDDEYNVLANFSKDLPEIQTNLIYTNTEFAEEHPDVVKQFAYEFVKLQRAVNDDSSRLAELIEEHFPQNADNAQQIAKTYIEADIVPTDGGMTMDDVQATIDFYAEGGSIEPGLQAADVADRSYLEAALAELE